MNVQFHCTEAVIHDRFNLNRGDVVPMPKGVADTLKAFGHYPTEGDGEGDANAQSDQTEGSAQGSAQGDGEKASAGGSDTQDTGVKMVSEPENKMVPDAEVENKADAPAPAPAPAPRGGKKR